MSTHKKHVGKACRTVREAKGWTINRTATESGLRAHQIEGIEDGSKSYTFDSLVQLCSVMGISIIVDKVLAYRPKPKPVAKKKKVKRKKK